MSQIHQRRQSNHPLVQTVWHSRNVTDGVYRATPDGSWDLIVCIAADGSKNMMLTGQATKPMDVPYRAGTGGMVISFVPGVYVQGGILKDLVDSFQILPNADADHFMLLGRTYPFPTFDTAEQLVSILQEDGILLVEPLVYSAFIGKPQAASERSRQRQFAEKTGLTAKYFNQIKRAQAAVRLLQQGKAPRDVAAELGYADQSHMARSLRKIMDSKPSGVDDIHKL